MIKEIMEIWFISSFIIGASIPIFLLIFIVLIARGHIRVSVTKEPREYFKVVEEDEEYEATNE